MPPSTYRLAVTGSLLSSFLFGLHVPALHDVVEHGASPRMDVLGMTVLFALGTVSGAWVLLRRYAVRRT